MLILLMMAVFWLAYSNGANDNLKGVATLLGSKTLSYRGALTYATITTILGSLLALYLGDGLVKTFSGKGLLPDPSMIDASFLIAVSLGAAATVFIATLIGMPISTTHALMGALAGAGFVAVGSELRWSVFASKFALPLLTSPVIAIVVTWFLYRLFRFTRLRMGITKESCICVGQEVTVVAREQNGAMMAVAAMPTLELGDAGKCEMRYAGSFAGVKAQSVVDALHYLSAGAVCFARGVNDTPKIAALLITASLLNLPVSLAAVGVVMALGGWLSARKVATTMSEDITEMNHGQGFTANLVTSFLVIVASRFGMPVSTTHVSCGSLFGLGMASGQANWKTIRIVLLAWVTTLPVAAGIAALIAVII